MASSILDAFIQIQHLLKLNNHRVGKFSVIRCHSNTTLVKVKLSYQFFNTRFTSIQIQHLLKLNQMLSLSAVKIL